MSTNPQFIGELFMKGLLLSALFLSPFLCVLAYRTWAGNVRQDLSPVRSALGVTSLAITFLNWIVFVLLIMTGGHNSELWVSISFASVTGALILGFAFKKSARTLALAGAPWVAIWCLQLYVFADRIKR